MMKHSEVIRIREQILQRLPDLKHILRGSLLDRTIRHRQGCPKCDRGQGHAVWVLTVGYPGGRTRQISLRPEQAPQVRQWLDHYQKAKAVLEKVCECNQRLLRPETPAPGKGGRRG